MTSLSLPPAERGSSWRRSTVICGSWTPSPRSWWATAWPRRVSSGSSLAVAAWLGTMRMRRAGPSWTTWNSRTWGSRVSRANCRGWTATRPPSRAGRERTSSLRPWMVLTRTRVRPHGQGSGSRVTRSVTSSRSSGWTRLYRLVTSSRAPGWPAGHRLAVGVDVLDQGGVLEQVDALVVLAFGAEQPLGAAVDVEGAYPEGVH